mgnify:CR=1 FL=1
MSVENKELYLNVEEFVADHGLETTSIPQVNTTHFDVSIRSAVKLLYPLLYADFENKGYSETHIKFRLWKADSLDVELIDSIESTLSELNDVEYNN